MSKKKNIAKEARTFVNIIWWLMTILSSFMLLMFVTAPYIIYTTGGLIPVFMMFSLIILFGSTMERAIFDNSKQKIKELRNLHYYDKIFEMLHEQTYDSFMDAYDFYMCYVDKTTIAGKLLNKPMKEVWNEMVEYNKNKMNINDKSDPKQYDHLLSN